MKKNLKKKLSSLIVILVMLSSISTLAFNADEQSMRDTGDVVNVSVDQDSNDMLQLYNELMLKVESMPVKTSRTVFSNPNILPEYQKIYPDNFAGIYQDGEEMVLNIVNQDQSMFSSQSFSNDTIEKNTLKTIAISEEAKLGEVKYSLNDLNQTMGILQLYVDNQVSTGIVYIARDIINNQIEIGINNISENERNNILNILKDANMIKFEEVEYSPDEPPQEERIEETIETLEKYELNTGLSTMAKASTKIGRGDELYVIKDVIGSTKYISTFSLGYGVYSSKYEGLGFFTTGHMTLSPDRADKWNVYHRSTGTYVGKIKLWNAGAGNTNRDFAFVLLNDNVTTTEYSGYYNVFDGMQVKKYGKTTGTTSGIVERSSVKFSDGKYDFASATYKSDSGDSGGGIFYGNSPAGLHKGRYTKKSDSKEYAYFTKSANIASKIAR